MMIIIESLLKIFDRDLQKLEEEIRQYPNDESLWQLSGEIKNTAGNLCLHLCGNLQHYIGARLGRTAYVRDRDNEFAAKGLSKDQLVEEIQRARQAVRETLETLKPSIMDTDYPERINDQTMKVSHFLIHLASHLNYHLGQINYHRRILAPSGAPASVQ